MKSVMKSVHSWLLDKPYSPLSSCLHVHSHSLLPVASHQLHLLCGSLMQVPVRVLWPTLAHVRVDGWRLGGGLSVVFSGFLFGGGWDLRVCSLAVNNKYQNSGLWAREIKSVRRKDVCCCNPSDQKKSVGPAFQCYHGSRREVSTNTLNEED